MKDVHMTNERLAAYKLAIKTEIEQIIVQFKQVLAEHIDFRRTQMQQGDTSPQQYNLPEISASLTRLSDELVYDTKDPSYILYLIWMKANVLCGTYPNSIPNAPDDPYGLVATRCKSLAANNEHLVENLFVSHKKQAGRASVIFQQACANFTGLGPLVAGNLDKGVVAGIVVQLLKNLPDDLRNAVLSKFPPATPTTPVTPDGDEPNKPDPLGR